MLQSNVIAHRLITYSIMLHKYRWSFISFPTEDAQPIYPQISYLPTLSTLTLSPSQLLKVQCCLTVHMWSHQQECISWSRHGGVMDLSLAMLSLLDMLELSWIWYHILELLLTTAWWKRQASSTVHIFGWINTVIKNSLMRWIVSRMMFFVLLLLYCSFFPGVHQVRIDDSKASGGLPSLAWFISPQGPMATPHYLPMYPIKSLIHWHLPKWMAHSEHWDIWIEQ